MLVRCNDEQGSLQEIDIGFAIICNIGGETALVLQNL
jgi:hypothetical protein